MTQEIRHKKGLFLTAVLLIAMLAFFLDLTIGIVSLLFTSVITSIESVLGATSTGSVLSSVIQIASGAVGLFSCISLWKLQKKGLFWFFLAVVLSLLANYMAWESINYFLITIYGLWVFIIFLNFKKLS